MYWFYKGMGLCLCLCLFCASCRLGWADDAVVQGWHAPLLQEVRIPAGVNAGVFYPEHDELVIIKPGAWAQEKEPSSLKEAAGADQRTDELKARITFSGRLKLNEALRIMADAAHRNLVVGPGVDDRDVTIDARDLSVGQALTRLLYPLGYGFKVNEGDLHILARDTRSFRLNLPPVTQSFGTSTSNESSSAGTSSIGSARGTSDGRVRVGAKVLVENSSGILSYWNDIEANVKSLVSAGGLVSLNKAAGVVVVTDVLRALEKIEAFFKDMNARSAEQLIVDVKVVEVELSNEHKLGIDWNALMSRGDLNGVRLSTNFASENISSGNMVTLSGQTDKDGAGDTASGMKGVLKALETFGRIEVVSQPRIMMLNNSVASIQVGETRSYVESTNMETTTGGATITSASLNEVHGGVTLQLVGSIVGKDVFLSVTPVVSTIDEIRTILLGGGNKLEAPETSMKTMTTLVRVEEGKTVAIGGLITRDRSKHQYGVPFLSKIPLLGKVFSYEMRKNRRTELVIFLTPRRG